MGKDGLENLRVENSPHVNIQESRKRVKRVRFIAFAKNYVPLAVKCRQS